MNIVMSGLDYSLAPLSLREQLSFTKSRVEELDSALSLVPGVNGCVLLSTCNRTEVYLSLEEGVFLNPGVCLCQAVGVDYELFAPAFVTRAGEEATAHLMAVSCGLKSQIWGEDQILSQVKTALERSREVCATDSLLQTVFRTAISAGKAVKHQVRLTGVPTSAAHAGVLALEQTLGELTGKTALVVGNGEMGRLAAGLLRDKGCHVTVTLRSYHHGETLVPAGCAVVAYEERYARMNGMELLVSATTSPHHTIALAEYRLVENPPGYLVDLAVPRDIDGAVGDLPGVTLFHVDNMGVNVGVAPEVLGQVEAILDEHKERLRHWWDYRQGLQEASHPRFPLFMDLSGKKVVVIGGGAIACRRIQTLEKFGAEITVIAPNLARKHEGITVHQRPYAPGDLDGATLVIVATDDRLVNQQVGQDATALGIPVSVADDASACTFYFPAVCVGGGVVTGVVSADGAHHSRTAKAAKAIRKTLEELP